jgi:uncharacterized membrane protein YsdA (DUF1294 family)/cold shock CspA family protein
MRHEGTLRRWDDERGFGFIEPSRGGPDVFVHIKAFDPRDGRPRDNQRLSFEIESGLDGKTCAARVRIAGGDAAAAAGPKSSARRRLFSDFRADATLAAIPAFAALYVVVTLAWGTPPLLLPVVYLALSAVTFIAYAWDKAAAMRAARRTPESTLHLLALAGGWPGALLAQQWLRHKSSKTSFRAVFWITVALNVAAFLLICSPAAARSLR